MAWYAPDVGLVKRDTDGKGFIELATTSGACMNVRIWGYYVDTTYIALQPPLWALPDELSGCESGIWVTSHQNITSKM